jgi:fluoride exporter
LNSGLLILMVFICGATGSVFRYLATIFLTRATSGRVIASVLLINCSGSFLAGLLGALAMANVSFVTPDVVWIAGVGFLGGFTTFSTWILQILIQIENKEYLDAFYNLITSLLLGTLAAASGFYSVQAFLNWILI